MPHAEFRAVAPPEHLSREAQRILAIPPAPAPHLPALSDKVGWRALAKVFDDRFRAMLAPKFEASLDRVTPATLHGVPAFACRPDSTDQPGRICLSIHGGAFVSGGGDLVAYDALRSAATTRLHTFSIDYRMPPDHPYPAAVDDALACYACLLQNWPAADIIVSGASAGGNIAAAMVLRARSEGLPMPAGLVLLSPELDLTESGDSFVTLLGIDNVLPVSLMAMNRLYAGTANLDDPNVSPLFAKLTDDFPRTFLQAGTRDLFLSNAVRMHRALRRARVEAELHVWDAMPHMGFGGGTPEDVEIADEVRRFVATCFARRHSPPDSVLSGRSSVL